MWLMITSSMLPQHADRFLCCKIFWRCAAWIYLLPLHATVRFGHERLLSGLLPKWNGWWITKTFACLSSGFIQAVAQLFHEDIFCSFTIIQNGLTSANFTTWSSLSSMIKLAPHTRALTRLCKWVCPSNKSTPTLKSVLHACQITLSTLIRPRPWLHKCACLPNWSPTWSCYWLDSNEVCLQPTGTSQSSHSSNDAPIAPISFLIALDMLSIMWKCDFGSHVLIQCLWGVLHVRQFLNIWHHCLRLSDLIFIKAIFPIQINVSMQVPMFYFNILVFDVISNVQLDCLVKVDHLISV